jgi:hypothetical protein
MAVGWYLRFSLSYRDRLEVGPAVYPGSQSAPALKAQADE